MRITAIVGQNRNNTANKQIKLNRQNTNLSNSPSFKAVKGLGDNGENLLKLIRDFIAKTGTEKNYLNARYAELEAAYSEAIKSGLEQNKLAVIEKLKELKMQVLDLYCNVRTEGSTLLNQLLDIELKVPIKVEPVKGFGFGKIAGYDDIKNILNREFISRIKQEKEGKNVTIPGVFAFFGPRGSGKTTSTLAIAEETGCIVEKIDAKPFDLPETVFAKFKRLFEKSRDNFAKDGRRIIFMDEFTKFNKGEDSKKQFAELLKDCSDRYKCTFFGATNHISQAGEDFMNLKPVLVAFEPASKYNAIQILKHYLQDSANNNINYSEIVDKILELCKLNKGGISNSRLIEIAKQAKKTTLNVDTGDVIKVASQYIGEKTIIPPQEMKRFADDYEKFMK